MLSAINSPFQMAKLYSSFRWDVKNRVCWRSAGEGCFGIARLHKLDFPGMADTPESPIFASPDV
jgi:hypothetical protein